VPPRRVYDRRVGSSSGRPAPPSAAWTPAVSDGKDTVSAIHVVQTVLYLVVFLFFVALIVRFVFDWIQYFSREWRPRGPVLVFAEGAYSATDPPMKALRRLLPPLPLGAIRLDLAFPVLMIVTVILLGVLAP
jgi:YggT family protein